MTTNKQWQPDVCIWHGGCDDGFTAAWAVWMKWGSEVRFVPGAYGKPLPDNLTGQRVLFVDFSLKRDAMIELGRVAHSVVVLDHHKTAEAELATWAVKDLKLGDVETMLALGQLETGVPVAALFDMNSSGARLAWDFCHLIPHNDPPPTIVAYVEDRDLWRFTYGDRTRQFSAALRTYEKDFAVWTDIAERAEQLVAEGKSILRGHTKNIADMIQHRYWDHVGGTKVPMVNLPYHYASDAADAILTAEPSAPFCAAWFRRGDGCIQFSLRSRDGRMDVSEVAKQYGGGGHRNAAGFTIAA